MHEILQKFASLLDNRFLEGVITTEDSVRYTYFAALLSAGILPHQVVLEYPHPAIQRAKIDTWLPDWKGSAVAVEFKYDRDPPGGKSQPKTAKAGAVFKDLQRQVLVAKQAATRSFFVYVTSQEMATYFSNTSNGHTEFWSLAPGACMRIEEVYFSGKPQTFRSKVGAPFGATIKGMVSCKLSGDNYLRSYEVLPHEH